MTSGRALLFGTLTVGTLDVADAMIFFFLFRGTRPTRIFQGIASDLLGSASFSGGLRTALFGVAIHYFIAFSVVATFLVVSRRVSFLRRWRVFSGCRAASLPRPRTIQGFKDSKTHDSGLGIQD